MRVAVVRSETQKYLETAVAAGSETRRLAGRAEGAARYGLVLNGVRGARPEHPSGAPSTDGPKEGIAHRRRRAASA
jgi:hypothetical protein